MDFIGDLKMMLELAEHGSFSAVGRLRGQAASSIARRLDRLEDHVGARLFNRTPTGLFLTAAGGRKLTEARDLVSAAELFRQADDALTGHFTISAPARLGEVCVAPAVSAFLFDHPDVSIDLHLTDTVQDLDRERIDLAVRIGRSAAGHHIIRRITANHRILVAAPSYLEHRKVCSIGDVEGCEGLLLGNTTRWRLRDSTGQTHTVHPKPRLRCISGDVLVKMCEAGLGVAMKSQWDVRQAIADRRLQHVLPGWVQAEPTDIALVMPDRRLIPIPLKIFARDLEQHLRRDLTTRAVLPDV